MIAPALSRAELNAWLRRHAAMLDRRLTPDPATATALTLAGAETRRLGGRR